jgi:hypothetical protein
MFEHAVNTFTETSEENEREARASYEKRLQHIIDERLRFVGFLIRITFVEAHQRRTLISEINMKLKRQALN